MSDNTLASNFTSYPIFNKELIPSSEERQSSANKPSEEDISTLARAKISESINNNRADSDHKISNETNNKENQGTPSTTDKGKRAFHRARMNFRPEENKSHSLEEVKGQIALINANAARLYLERQKANDELAILLEKKKSGLEKNGQIDPKLSARIAHKTSELQAIDVKLDTISHQLSHMQKMHEDRLEEERKRAESFKAEKEEQEKIQNRQNAERQAKAESIAEAKRMASLGKSSLNIADKSKMHLKQLEKHLEEHAKQQALLQRLRQEYNAMINAEAEERQKVYIETSIKEGLLQELKQKIAESIKDLEEDLEEILEAKELQKIIDEEIYEHKQEIKEQVDDAVVILEGYIEIVKASTEKKEDEVNSLQKKVQVSESLISEIKKSLVKQIIPIATLAKGAEELSQKAPDPSKMSDLLESINAMKKVLPTLKDIETSMIISNGRNSITIRSW